MTPERLSSLAKRAARRYRVPGLTREDLAQEAALAMLSHGGDDERELLDCANRRLWDLCRRELRNARRRRTERLSADPPSAQPAHEDEVSAWDFFDHLLTFLTPQQALVLEMSVRQGLRDEVIADGLQISLRTVAVARSAARRRLATLLI